MFRIFLACACALSGSTVLAEGANFEDKTLPANSFYNGSDGAGGFVSNGVHFNNSYESTFGTWGGFAYSNVNDTTTAGFTNQYAAIPGSGYGGAGIYAVMFDPGPFGPPNTITLPHVSTVQSMRITNATYAFLAIRDGNDGFGGVRQFGDDPNLPGTGNQGYPDWFRLTITGIDALNQPTGTIDFYLADYRFALNGDDRVLNTWEEIDLSPLGSVKSLTLSLSSSDVGPFGMNTPAYVALDEIIFVPEPQMGMLAILMLGLTRRR